MADYLIQDSTLTDIADAIRAKTGNSATMTPSEMPTEIGSIQTGGGGGFELLASGVYNHAITGTSTTVTIPVSYTGTAYAVYVEAERVADTAQTFAWLMYINRSNIGNELLPHSAMCRSYTAANALVNTNHPAFYNFTDNTSIYVGQQSSGYPVRPGQYHWYIWGVAE